MDYWFEPLKEYDQEEEIQTIPEEMEKWVSLLDYYVPEYVRDKDQLKYEAQRKEQSLEDRKIVMIKKQEKPRRKKKKKKKKKSQQGPTTEINLSDDP